MFKDNGTDYENEYKGKLEYEAILKFIEDEAE